MHSDNVTTTVSQTRDRKTTKPIMEKRRRARINASLTEIKSLLLDTIKKEGSRHGKMEKADILEMTVKHLRQMQRQQLTGAVSEDPSFLDKYRLGFTECAQEVKKYITSMESCDAELKTKVLNHVANCLTGVEEFDQLPRTTVSAPPSPPSSPEKDDVISKRSRLSPRDDISPLTVDVNNNVSAMPSLEPAKTGNVFSGLQVIPTQLSSGEIAFVLPTNILRTAPTPNYVIPVFTGSPPAGSVQVSPSITSTNQTCSQRSTNISVVDRSYLPCATVTPVQPVINHSPNDVQFAIVKQQPQADEERNHQNVGQNEEQMWRPW